MNCKEEITARIRSLSGKYNPYDVFSDWVECMALSISNGSDMLHGKVYAEREERYMSIMKKYSDKERHIFTEMYSLLTLAMDEEMGDLLGDIYMSSGAGSKIHGQFFTPYHISYMVAKLTVGKRIEDGDYTINEPSCGGGGMIIATAQALKEAGVNYKYYMDVVAQDLDWKAVYMCYVQLSMYGIKAVVCQGDALISPYAPRSTPERHVLYTPAKRGLLV